MKYRQALFAVCVSLAFVPPAAKAQDGWLFSSQPPIVFRTDGLKVYFTNTSDQVLHGITLHNDNKGDKTSTVIIDTIQPHKTATLEWSVRFLTPEPTITCTNYSKPLSLKKP